MYILQNKIIIEDKCRTRITSCRLLKSDSKLKDFVNRTGQHAEFLPPHQKPVEFTFGTDSMLKPL